jgi:hypothetical protein
MIRMNVRGMEALQQKLKEIPHGTKRIAVQAFTDYIIGDDAHGLKHYPPVTTQKYVRTFTLKKGWVRTTGDEYKPVIHNYTPYAEYVVGDEKQAKLLKDYGWRKVKDIIASNMDGAIRHAQALVNKYLKAWK